MSHVTTRMQSEFTFTLSRAADLRRLLFSTKRFARQHGALHRFERAEREPGFDANHVAILHYFLARLVLRSVN